MRGRDHKACCVAISRWFRIRHFRAAWQPHWPNPTLCACFFWLWRPFLCAPIACAAPQSRAPLCIFRMRERKVARIIQRAHRRHFSSPHIWHSTRLPVCLPVRTQPLLHGPWSRCPSIGRRNKPASETRTTSPSGHRFEHRFLGSRKRSALCGRSAFPRTLDYFSTLNFRRRGRNEALLTNDVVDNHAAFASSEAAATVASIGLSYVFHRYITIAWNAGPPSSTPAGYFRSGANYCPEDRHP